MRCCSIRYLSYQLTEVFIRLIFHHTRLRCVSTQTPTFVNYRGARTCDIFTFSKKTIHSTYFLSRFEWASREGHASRENALGRTCGKVRHLPSGAIFPRSTVPTYEHIHCRVPLHVHVVHLHVHKCTVPVYHTIIILVSRYMVLYMYW